MKASVAFVLLAFLSATTAKVHVQNRKASKVIEDPDEANNFLKRQSACITCPSLERCCLPSVCQPIVIVGKCFNYPTEIARETGQGALDSANEVKRRAQRQLPLERVNEAIKERVQEKLSERT